MKVPLGCKADWGGWFRPFGAGGEEKRAGACSGCLSHFSTRSGWNGIRRGGLLLAGGEERDAGSNRVTISSQIAARWKRVVALICLPPDSP
ncbi:MAG: hypothetical protein DDT29_02298 [Dehalococcoidia bacterium]|nr:hypothetical protein [Bacillota bacterium]